MEKDSVPLPRILFVEEDDLLCRLVTYELESHGHSVVSITRMRDSRAALAFRPHIVVIDLGMAWLDDYRLIRELGRSPVDTALILARDTDLCSLRAARDAAAQAGVEILGVIDKPYMTHALLPVIARYKGAVDGADGADMRFLRQLIADDRLLDNLAVEFQPKQCLKTNRVVGYEALSRVRNRRALNPELLFSANVELALQYRATDIVVETALAFWRALDREGRAVPVSINCSAAMLSDMAFVEQSLIEAVRKGGVPMREVTVELTENGPPVDADALKAGVGRLVARGIRISIDDFGRGAANFDRITSLPFHELKLDKQVFWACAESDLPPLALRDLIAHCEANGTIAVIEGIETARHRALAKLMGAHQGQGFYWGRAMPPQFYVAFDERSCRRGLP